MEIELQYSTLRKGPKNQDVDKWLDSWNQTYLMAQQEEMPEVSGTRSIRDFLLAIEEKDPHFSAVYTLSYNRGELADMFEVVEAFRQSYRLKTIQKAFSSGKSHSAFLTDKSSAEKTSSSPSPATQQALPKAQQQTATLHHTPSTSSFKGVPI